MNQIKEPPRPTLQLYATAPYPCSYLDGRQSRSQVVTPAHLIDADIYSDLVTQGFRRSGLYTYRPYCDGCQSCIPCRLVTASFIPKRHQQRAWRKHQNLVVRMLPLVYQEEHYALYLRYQSSRHVGGGMDGDDQNQYQQFLLQSHVNSRLIEFRDGPSDPEPGKLRIVAIMDVLNDGLSSVYTFFDTTCAQSSYGTYAILWQIDHVKHLHLNYLYLGYYIQDSPKMSYKISYQPIQLLKDNQWQVFDSISEAT